ncbi:uncharacterized protein LOC131655013 isoform X2 [Vicia villosa]|uniref:uncharacterized protein LOC131655013 isoform X2 n=1 Tax=Vicia villosa TaxID=3911 RepID=UPI00273B0ACE|nr:uncharacterized protein LOC131655013 isoform X2 [Vicia villosa]
MDGEIRVWCLEHLLRKSSIKTNLINKLISKISLSNTDYRTKKTIILRTLEDALSEAFIPEYMLQIFEVLEKLLLCHDSSNPNSNSIAAAMKAAYCSIAVESTLKHLDAGISNPIYGKAVKRIWEVRVHDMHNEGSSFLLSDELKEWKSEIEKSLLDGEVRKKLASIPFTRRDAIVKVQAFLAEAWEDLGPSFLESAAKNQLDSSVGGLQMKKQHEKVSPIEILKDNEKAEGKFTTVVDVEKVDLSASCGKADTLPINEKTKNGESLKCSSVELQTLAKDSGLVIEDTNEEPQMENPSLDANLPNAQACQGSNNNETNLNETTSVHQSDAHRPNLMKPNSTARTHEIWHRKMETNP